MHRFSSNAMTVLSMEYGRPIFIDMPNVLPSSSRRGSPFARRTVPEPSISGCRAGSARKAKIASGAAGISRSTVSDSRSSLIAA